MSDFATEEATAEEAPFEIDFAEAKSEAAVPLQVGSQALSTLNAYGQSVNADLLPVGQGAGAALGLGTGFLYTAAGVQEYMEGDTEAGLKDLTKGAGGIMSSGGSAATALGDATTGGIVGGLGGVISGTGQGVIGLEEIYTAETTAETLTGIQDTTGGFGKLSTGVGGALKAVGATTDAAGFAGAGFGLSAISGGAQAVNGAMVLAEDDASVTDQEKAALNVYSGATSAGLGTVGLAGTLAGGTAGAAMASTAGPAGAALAAGVAYGGLGNEMTADSEVLQSLLGADPATGEPMTAREWALSTGESAQNSVADMLGGSNQDLLPTLANYGVTTAMSIPAAAVAAAAPLLNVGEGIYDWLAE